MVHRPFRPSNAARGSELPVRCPARFLPDQALACLAETGCPGWARIRFGGGHAAVGRPGTTVPGHRETSVVFRSAKERPFAERKATR